MVIRDDSPSHIPSQMGRIPQGPPKKNGKIPAKLAGRVSCVTPPPGSLWAWAPTHDSTPPGGFSFSGTDKPIRAFDNDYRLL